MIAIDCETNGVDFFHGSAAPFFVTTCDDGGEQTWWEWEVNPLTRKPSIPEDDLRELRRLIDGQARWDGFDDEIRERHAFIFHNAKFDIRVLGGVLPGLAENWPWGMTRDTLTAGHLLRSDKRHNLTDMADFYLGEKVADGMLDLEDRLEKVVKHCQRFCRTNHSEWRLAKKGDPSMPSAKEKTWKFDTWLPRALVRHYGGEAKLSEACGRDVGGYATALRDYANADSAVTVELWKVCRKLMDEKGLRSFFDESMKLIPVTLGMENHGVTVHAPALERLKTRFVEESEAAGKRCVNIATSLGYDLTLPKSGRNKSLDEFAFDVLKLPPVGRTDKGKPAFDNESKKVWAVTLPRASRELAFVRSLSDKSARDTARTYLEGYQRFWLPYEEDGKDEWYVLHPNLNLTGTTTLRGSSNNPNGQNISKKESECARCDGEGCTACGGTGRAMESLRNAFRPPPGYEWWALDFKNLELRIPAYESGERASIELFERPDDPPYFGSNHLLVAHIVFPREFEACRNEFGEIDGRVFQSRYKSTLYRNTKNGNFAKQYRCGDRKADRTYGVDGASQLIRERFSKLEALNSRWVDHANRYGYVETVPDRTVCPDRGYPIWCERVYGRIKPTLPLSYHVQSTAMWCTRKAMVRTEQRLSEWRKKGFRATMVLQIHDELLFQMPYREGGANLPRVLELQALMEESGNDIGMPLPVSYSYHPVSWGEEAEIIMAA